MSLFNLTNLAYVAFNENYKTNFLDAEFDFKLKNKNICVSFHKDNYFNLISMVVDDKTLEKATEVYMNQRFINAFSGFSDYSIINFFDKDEKSRCFLAKICLDIPHAENTEFSVNDFNLFITCFKVFIKQKLSDYYKVPFSLNNNELYDINENHILIKEDTVQIMIEGEAYQDILNQVKRFFSENFENHLIASNNFYRYNKVYSNVNYILSLDYIDEDTSPEKVRELFVGIKNELGDFFE